MAKKDPQLGRRVHLRLEELNLETPFTEEGPQMAAEETIEHAFTQIMKSLGLDLKDEGLAGTPKRVAKMFRNEIFEGMEYHSFPSCTSENNGFDADSMVIVGDISVASTCMHHFQNIEGVAKVAYIPNKKVLGLSKFNRIVRFFSKRPQIQERLTLQIQAALCLILGTEDVAVEIRAIHHCVKARGIEDKNSFTTTRKLGGKFKATEAVRNEFLNSK